MSLCTLACRIPPATGANGSPSKVSKVTMMNRQARPCPQVKEKEKPLLQESLTSKSRREMIHFTAASVGLLSLLSSASAEASAGNASIGQKIMEKLEELLQRAGLSNPNDENEEKKPKDEGKLKLQSGNKETKPEPKDEKDNATTPEESTVPPTEEEPSVPALPGIINSKTVES